mmetsp:Transcript_21943/g.37482  ORF Transcript_21943/g.37482 Transcript_21943/m.37482 type:complete len:506 (+) Transcript_21943:56-1573(+)
MHWGKPYCENGAMLLEITTFRKSRLSQAETVEKNVLEFFGLEHTGSSAVHEACFAPPLESHEAFSAKTLQQRTPMEATLDDMHGRAFGFESERATWKPPLLAVSSAAEARPGYNTMTASEFVEEEVVLRAKVRRLAALLRGAKRPVFYCGAGLSTSAGISDYASQKGESLTSQAQPALQESLQRALANKEASRTSYKSPLCAQPALAHRVLVGLQRAGHLHRLVQQNHDGLPQKAGMPQEVMNEIHGACHSPDNPVVPMSGSLRPDLFEDLLECERTADLAVAIGTSLCGMNADRVVSSAAERAARGASAGAVIIGLQRTVHDSSSTLRIFAPIDEVFRLLAEEMSLPVTPALPEGTYFLPPVLRRLGSRLPGPDDDSLYLLRGLAYDAAGKRLADDAAPAGKGVDLDLRDGAQVVVPTGMHAGATGEVDGTDREGNPRCRFRLKLKAGSSFKAPFPMLLGTWHMQAAADATVPQLPLVNVPATDDLSPAAASIRALCAAYGSAA